MWIRRRKEALTASIKRLSDYIEEHPDNAVGLSEKLDECEDRLGKVNAAWHEKRN